MSKIKQIQALVRNGLYYLTEHADNEAIAEDFDTYDVERGPLTGRIRRTWPREGKYEVIGSAWDDRPIGIVCRITPAGKVRIITVYEDRPKK
ncbi:DUF4258 domain-containing protein [Candidatus Poribacteria bacterium]|nr:DUF4258 domain-containing protein [Candidatus Poribacteria bacterium]